MDAIIDREAILDRVGGDVGFFQEIAGIFAEDCPKMLANIRSAVTGGDAKGLEQAAHALKGSVANFGAEPAREAAFRLEMLGRKGDLAPAQQAWLELEQEMVRFNQALIALADQLGRA